MTKHHNSQFSPAEEDTQVLNSYLYRRLRECYGSVVVAKPGEPSQGEHVPHDHGSRYRFVHSGEYYRVNCPFCVQRRAVDTRQRLWIHHRWGVGLDQNDDMNRGDKFWWAAVCYNEGCMDRPDNVAELRTRVYGSIGRDRHAPTVTVLTPHSNAVTLGIVDWPGQCLRVDQLHHGHQAVQYLLSRGFDPQVVGPKYDVSFCQDIDARYPVAHNKLIFPIKMHGNMVSWQARPPYDIDFSAAGQPKYYNAPGTNRRLMLYNYDASKDLPWCALVEGVTDVWALGDGAIASFGKTLAAQQADIIASTWKAAVIAMDPDAMDAAKRIQAQLNRIPTVLVQMPEGMDPASLDHDYFWDLVLSACAQQQVELPNS